MYWDGMQSTLYEDDWTSGWLTWIGFLYIPLTPDDGNDMAITLSEKKNYTDYKEIDKCLPYNLYILYTDLIRASVLFFCHGILNGRVRYIYLVDRVKLL